MTLARLDGLTVAADVEAPKASASSGLRQRGHRALTGAVDFEAELARLDKELGKIEKDFVQVNKKAFTMRASSARPRLMSSPRNAPAPRNCPTPAAKLVALQQRFRDAIGK